MTARDVPEDDTVESALDPEVLDEAERRLAAYRAGAWSLDGHEVLRDLAAEFATSDDEAFVAELNRRIVAAEAGAPGIPAEVVRRELEALIGELRRGAIATTRGTPGVGFEGDIEAELDARELAESEVEPPPLDPELRAELARRLASHRAGAPSLDGDEVLRELLAKYGGR